MIKTDKERMMVNLPTDLKETLTHEPRFVEVDQSSRRSGGDELWWRGLVDTSDCHDPEEIAEQFGLPVDHAELNGQ